MFRRRNNTNSGRRRQRHQIEKRIEQQTPYLRATTTSREGDAQAAMLSIVSRILKLSVVVLIVGVCGYLLYVNRSPIIRISDQEQPILEISSYQKTAENIMRSSPVYLSKVSFDYQGFKNEMIKEHPEIASLTTTFGVIADQPIVSISFYRPAILVESLNTTWLLDSNGLAIAQVSQETEDDRYQSLLTVRDDLGLQIEQRKAVLAPADIDFINNAYRMLESGGVDVITTTIPVNAREINFQLAQPNIVLRMNLDETAASQAGASFVALDTLRRNGVVPTEYIDVRPGEKVFWK